MSRTRVLLLVVLAALVWVWASSTRMPLGSGGRSASPATQGAARGPAVFDLQVTTERLEARRGVLGTAPRPTGRNPFQFAAEAGASREPQAAQPSTPSAAIAATATVAGPPALTLLGIVDRTVDDKPVRVAVVSMADTLYYVSVGDRVGSRYETVAVSADAVELKDLIDGSTRRVALK
jgi:hypothetical protein